jgi:DNA-binding transcriptional LysR family regulator
MSKALSRLRRRFGDPLLVREGRGLALTPTARELQHAVEPALAMVERALRIEATFDPSAATQHFRIAASDYGVTRIADRVSDLPRVAPGITIDFVHVDRDFVRSTETVLRHVDLLLAPQAFLSGYPCEPLSGEPWVAVVDSGHIGDIISESDLAERSLVGLFHDSGSGAHIERLLTVRGIVGAGAVNAESFHAVPALVAGTGRVGFLPASLANRLAAAYPIRVLETPFLTEPLVECLYWHRSAQRDPANRWLRTFLLSGRPASTD